MSQEIGPEAGRARGQSPWAQRQWGPSPSAGTHEPGTPVARALAFLLEEARAGFPDTCHRMRFPRWAGFSAGDEDQEGDVFARAVLGGLLLDVADRVEATDPASATVLRAAAREQAHRVADAKVASRRGGWSYFPGLPELPPDLDSLGAVLHLLARAAPELSARCEEPIAVAMELREPSGAIPTWLVSARDAPADRERMERAIARWWGPAIDVDVCARFHRALLLHDAARYGPEAAGGLRFVVSAQQGEGGWPGSWYGDVYGTALCLELVDEAERRGIGDHAAVIGRAADRIAGLQRRDGGWGARCSYPLETAVAVTALARHAPDRHADRLALGLHWLLDYQTAEGFWEGTPWILMRTGRAQGPGGPTLSFGSRTVTTALALRALLEEGGDSSPPEDCPAR